MLPEVTHSVLFYGAQLQRIVDELLTRLEAENRLKMERHTLGAAYMGILRGLHANLLYQGPADTGQMFEAMWLVFEQAAFLDDDH